MYKEAQHQEAGQFASLSALPQAIPGSGTGMTLWLISITLFVVGSLLGGLNYIVTILNLDRECLCKECL